MSFAKNLSLLYQRSNFRTQDDLAAELGIAGTSLSRLMSGAREKSPTHLTAISDLFRIDSNDFFIDHNTFQKYIENMTFKTSLVLFPFEVIRQSRKDWAQFFTRIEGQYNLYLGRTKDDYSVVSLLTVGRLTEEGITFTLFNPFRDGGGEISAFEYIGYMYPIKDFIYIFGEQTTGNVYELLTFILHIPRSPKITLLRGLMSGVGVNADISVVAADAILLLKRKKLIKDPYLALGTELGYIQHDKLPRVITQNYKIERIRVTV